MSDFGGLVGSETSTAADQNMELEVAKPACWAEGKVRKQTAMSVLM